MKGFRSILPLLCILPGFFCACGHKPYPHPLIVADRLANACPDSAIALLDELKPRMSHEPEATRMYYTCSASRRTTKPIRNCFDYS